MKKILSLLMSVSLTGCAVQPVFSYTTNKNVTSENAEGSTNTDDFMWGGLALQYFILKSSTASTDANFEKLAQVFKNNAAGLGIGSFDTNNEIKLSKYYRALASTIIDVSEYGQSSFQEFFAEAFSKWQTTPDQAKNKSWEILNYFFLHLYKGIKQNYSGAYNSTQNSALQKYIDGQMEKDNFTLQYNFSLSNRPTELTNADLFYNSDFGFAITNDDGKLFQISNYAIDSIYSSLAFYRATTTINSTGTSATYDGSGEAEFLAYLKQDSDFVQLLHDSPIWMNDSYTKATDQSIKEFEDFLANSKKDYYQTFDELNSSLYELTETNDGDHTIALKNSIESMATENNENSDWVEKYEEQVLEMFDISFAITDYDDNSNYLEYYLTGFILAPDYPLRGNQDMTNVMAYTSTSFYQLQNAEETAGASAFSFIVYSQESMTMYQDPSENDQYQMNWWSSPNIFATLNHEFGHVLDAYLGATSQSLAMNKADFKDIISENNPNEIYQNGSLPDPNGDDSDSGGFGISSSTLIYIIVGCVIGAICLVAGFVSPTVIKRRRRR